MGWDGSKRYPTSSGGPPAHMVAASQPLCFDYSPLCGLTPTLLIPPALLPLTPNPLINFRDKYKNRDPTSTMIKWKLYGLACFGIWILDFG